MIDKNSTIPLYIQLAEDLKEQIKQKENGDLFYSEKELQAIYNLSRPTIRHAIEYLVQNNYLYKEKGKGTFVSSKYLMPKLNSFYSFSEFLKANNLVNEDHILNFSLLDSFPHHKLLALEPDEKVYCIQRLRLSNKKPVIFQNIYVPYKLFPNLTLEMLNENGLYNSFNKFFNIKITEINDSFQITYIDTESSELLQQPKGSAAMMITRISSSNNVPVEYTVSIASGEDFIFQLHLTNKE